MCRGMVEPQSPRGSDLVGGVGLELLGGILPWWLDLVVAAGVVLWTRRQGKHSKPADHLPRLSSEA